MAMLALPIAGQVGLQLILEPATSPAVAKGACCIFGEVLPAYSTYKAVTRTEPRELALRDRTAWLQFWSVYTTLGILERITDVGNRVKGYYHVKLILLLWLTSRRYQGARRVFREILQPCLDSVRKDVDAALSDCSAFVDRPEGKAFFSYIHDALAGLPILKWFVRDPPPF